jgi:hypothetical protein
VRDWLEDIFDQLSLAELLGRSQPGVGQRLGLIIVDNGVEYMLVAYIEVFKGLSGRRAPKGWEDIKRSFRKLLDCVATHEAKLAPLSDEIMRYHNFRNELYHTGTPKTTTTERVLHYRDLARTVLASLFNTQLTEEDWGTRLDSIRDRIVETTREQVKAGVTFSVRPDAVSFKTHATLTSAQAICLALDGFSKEFARDPSRDEIARCMSVSGQGLGYTSVSSRLAELRRQGLVAKGKLALTTKGRKRIRAKFIT